MALNYSTLRKPANAQVVDPETGRMREEWALYFDQLTKRLNGAVGELSTDYTDLTEIAEPGSPGANVARVYAFDDGGVTRLAYKDNAGTARTLASTSEFRVATGADVTYYVRTDGSNSNTGLVDSAGGAFLTLQHAYNVIAQTRDLVGFNVTIQLGDGTYTAGLDAITPIQGQGILSIVGNVGTPANVILSVTNAHGILNRTGSTIIQVSGIDFRTTTAGNCLWAWKNSGIIVAGAVRFGASAGDHCLASEGGLIEIATNYTISGNAVNHWHTYGGGEIICQNRTITLSGTPAFSGNFSGNAQGAQYISGNTFSGSATGTRFLVHKNGMNDTGGASATYLPGNAVGTITGAGTVDNVFGQVLSSSPTGGIGFTTGAGDAVTQSTSKSTTVATNNKMCGQITMNNATLNAGASVVFQTNNSNVDANDIVIVTVSNGVSANSYTALIVHTGAGSFNTRVTNISGSNLSDAVVLNFAIIKGVTS